jgi:hypothetical protein
MAKPRRIVLKDGYILLNGFPKDVANQLEAHLAKFTMDETASPVNDGVRDKKVFTDFALGLKEYHGQYKVVVVGYEYISGKAEISELKDAGDFKAHAISVFQQEMYKRGMV